MAKATVYNLRKEKVGEIDLSDEVFGAPVNQDLFYEVVKAQLASRRSGTAAVKERSAVAGSTKKIYRQKGTGRARHGSIRAPNFVGGGKAHGPVPRSYAYRPPRKMRISALRSALSMLFRDGKLLVVKDFELAEPKTKALVEILETLDAGQRSLLVDDRGNDKLRLSARNLEHHLYLPPEGVNVYDVLRHDSLLCTEAAIRALESRCSDGGAA
ncbi:MAG: 50S ribosomal protein L4 [Deltaproteobacteria bacterium]|nr:50S ribosomal protein L4 [Deltaproteobacteria bacterium]